jgi:hypothetical protein
MSADLFDDIHSPDSVDEDIIHIPTSSTTFTGASASSYTSNQLQRFLKYDNQKVCILTNESVKSLASWWRSFGYPAILNEKMNFNEFPVLIMVLHDFQQHKIERKINSDYRLTKSTIQLNKISTDCYSSITVSI